MFAILASNGSKTEVGSWNEVLLLRKRKGDLNNQCIFNSLLTVPCHCRQVKWCRAGEVVQSRLTAPTMDTGHPRALKHLLWQKPQPCREGTPHTLDNELQTDPDKHNSSWKGI